MKTTNQKIKELENLNRSGTRSRAEIKAEVMKEMDTFVGTKAQLVAKEAELDKKYLSEVNNERSSFNKKVLNLWIEVQQEVSKEEGLDFDHKKVKEAWNIAWDEAHNAGYGEVVNYFRTICELLKDE
jgi:hypothetical protein